MDKKLFAKLMKAATQAADHAQGKHISQMREYKVVVPSEVDVKTIRTKLGMTQETFAKTFGFSLSGLRKWESHERQPEGPARVLLHMIGKDAATVLHLASQ
jgi:putative transcriptional regulator